MTIAAPYLQGAIPDRVVALTKRETQLLTKALLDHIDIATGVLIERAAASDSARADRMQLEELECLLAKLKVL